MTSKPPTKDSGPDSVVVSNTVFLAGEERLSPRLYRLTDEGLAIADPALV